MPRRPRSRFAVVVLAVASLAACGRADLEREAGAAGPPVERPAWAIAIHGGAGVIGRDLPDARRDAYLAALEGALREGIGVLEGGGTSLDAVERVVRRMEDDPLFNAGRGAVFDASGGHELDASIMRGDTLACGAVAAVRSVRNPIGLARLVMERTPHVLLVGAGAEAFADEMGVERVPQAWYSTPHRREAWERERRERTQPQRSLGTVGAVALDRMGHLAAATSTGGLTYKRPGRVGDSPIPGAGTYADDRTCAVSATGHGEQFIRHAVAYAICSPFRGAGATMETAAERVIVEVLDAGDGGVVGVDRNGAIAMAFNTEGMYRGAADAAGRFEVAIW